MHPVLREESTLITMHNQSNKRKFLKKYICLENERCLKQRYSIHNSYFSKKNV